MSFGNLTLIPILLSKEVSDMILSMLKKLRPPLVILKHKPLNSLVPLPPSNNRIQDTPGVVPGHFTYLSILGP